jgi:hypothetical protein
MPEKPSPPTPTPSPPVPPPEPLPSPPVAKLQPSPTGDGDTPHIILTLPTGKRLQFYFARGNKKRSAGSTLAAHAASL